jgi:DNA-binding response OmpR family regulator
MQKREIERILVVDDEPDVGAMLIKFFRPLGYLCRSVTDPAEVPRILKQGDFELVLSDIVMPGMDGLQLLNEISRVAPEVDVIIMTAFETDYTYSDIIEAGAVDFITKPFHLPELKAKVERIDRERKMRRELRELNVALGVLLQRAEKEKEELSDGIVSNVQKTILPYFEKLNNFRLPEEAKMYIQLLESNLSEICSPLMRNLSLQHAHISSMEVQVANLVKAGKSNKEIAAILGVSLNTVMTHRHRLRSKLGLKQQKVNLRSYLNSIHF